jgi:peptidoglycan/LPS O-acetylase OafA/YrhL
MQLKFLQKFKRVTYSTSYLPEIDGLRFLAVFSVVVIMHVTHYLNEKFYSRQLLKTGYWKTFELEGGHGVFLFFIISGFILSLPFAKWRLNNGKSISLKNYYLRRLTRLEPPYIIALIILFIGHVWVLNKYSFADLFPHFLASLIYQHTTIYQSFPSVLPAAWSLEVEVQFYVLAPLFFLVFLIRQQLLRWSIYTVLIFGNAWYWFDSWNIANVFSSLHVFFMGIFLADLYCSKVALIKDGFWGLAVGIICLAAYLFVPSINYVNGILHFNYLLYVKMVSMFLLFHSVLNNNYIKKIFSVEIITIIGGMCYSIYLMHFAVISAAGAILIKMGMSSSNQAFFIIYAVTMIAAVLLISSLFFILFEKPFMKPVQWLKKTR